MAIIYKNFGVFFKINVTICYNCEKYLCIIPSTNKDSLEAISKKYSDVISHQVTNPYNSSVEKKMTKLELKEYLESKKLI